MAKTNSSVRQRSSKAADKCFDRDTGDKVPAGVLKTYAQALAQYHLRPEHKFSTATTRTAGSQSGDMYDPQPFAKSAKESNRWEEQFYLGGDEGAEIDHGIAPEDESAMLDRLRMQVIATGQRRVARESGVSRRTIERLTKGGKVRDAVVAKILSVLKSA